MFTALFSESQSRIDRLQLAALCALMLIGGLFVYSATLVTESAAMSPWFKQIWIRQIFWYLIGAGGAAALCLISYQTLARWSMVGYWFGIALLIAVLFLGSSRGGARRWFDLGFFSLQPSEFAKLAYILAQASFLSRPTEELRDPMLFFKSIGMMLLPFVLIMKEPDLGSALVLVPTGLALQYAAGVPKKYLAWMAGGVGCLAALLLVDVLFAPPKWQIKLQEYQRQRLLVYFGRDFAPQGASAAERP